MKYNLISYDLVSVSPLGSPNGNLFYMDYVYKTKSEIIREKRKEKIIYLDRLTKLEYIDMLLKNN